MAQNRPFHVNRQGPARASSWTASPSPAIQSSSFGWTELALPSPAPRPPLRPDMPVLESIEASNEAGSWPAFAPGAPGTAPPEFLGTGVTGRPEQLPVASATAEELRRKRHRLSTPETTTLARICVTNRSAYGLPGKTGAYWTMIAAELEKAIGHPFSNVRQRMESLTEERRIQLRVDETGTTTRANGERTMAIDAWLAVVNEIEERDQAVAGHIAKKRRETANAAKEKDFLMLGAAARVRAAADLPDEAGMRTDTGELQSAAETGESTPTSAGSSRLRSRKRGRSPVTPAANEEIELLKELVAGI